MCRMFFCFVCDTFRGVDGGQGVCVCVCVGRGVLGGGLLTWCVRKRVSV